MVAQEATVVPQSVVEDTARMDVIEPMSKKPTEGRGDSGVQ